MDVIVWPERPTCHDQGWQAQRFGTQICRPPSGRRPTVEWDEKTHTWQELADVPLHGDNKQYRTCSYCGSIHPEDFYNYLTTVPNLKVGGSDWKYGWPHKFYIENIPNLAWAKWYNIHLLDLEQSAFDALAPILYHKTGIRWERKWLEDKGRFDIFYAAPYRGYQS